VRLTSTSFRHEGPIPPEFAFARPDPAAHVALAGNRNPHLAWDGVPRGTKSLALLVVDPDAPSVADDVNKEGRSVPADLRRADFHHWVLVDMPPTCRAIAAGECSSGVTARGKRAPAAPAAAPRARQGVNDYTGWFAGDPQMKGTYLGYDGPAPPWNDERVHRYHFLLYALDIERVHVDGAFSAADVRRAIAGHILEQATLTGTYTLNPKLARASGATASKARA
jgi:hypothetical protein